MNKYTPSFTEYGKSIKNELLVIVCKMQDVWGKKHKALNAAKMRKSNKKKPIYSNLDVLWEYFLYLEERGEEKRWKS